MGFQKGHRRFGGRKKGVPNHAKLAASVYAQLRQEKKLTEQDISVALLTCGIPQVIQKEHARLQEYLYGKLPQPQEVSGPGGWPVRIVIDGPRPKPEEIDAT